MEVYICVNGVVSVNAGFGDSALYSKLEVRGLRPHYHRNMFKLDVRTLNLPSDSLTLQWTRRGLKCMHVLSYLNISVWRPVPELAYSYYHCTLSAFYHECLSPGVNHTTKIVHAEGARLTVCTLSVA